MYKNLAAMMCACAPTVRDTRPVCRLNGPLYALPTTSGAALQVL